MLWMVPFLLVGMSFTVWTVIAIVRWTAERSSVPTVSVTDGSGLSPADVAVLIPAHNEETGIGSTIVSALRLVPVANIHVVADGCSDATASIASSYGVNVLVLDPGRGKAGGIECAVEHFRIVRHFAVMLIVDADTELADDYLSRGLRLLDDPEMVAVAGYALSSWEPASLTFVGRLLASYRARLYVVMQWMKYAQTWRYTNVTPIVPGFASMYRTTALAHIDINPPGLVIEDFNMTFELRHKKLGKVALDPAVYGVTQDPENLPDYYRQVSRWSLGLFQTLRRHKLTFSWFSATLAVFLFEVILASAILIVLGIALVFLAVNPITGGLAHDWSWYSGIYDDLAPYASPLNLLMFVLLPDYLLTCAAAIYLRRPSLLVYGPLFLFVRLIDAAATLRSLWTLRRTKSTGRWTSPTRRATAVVAPRPAHEPTDSPGPQALAGSSALLARSTTATTAHRQPTRNRLERVGPVLGDATGIATLLALIAGSELPGLPTPLVLLAGTVALVGACYIAARTGTLQSAVGRFRSTTHAKPYRGRQSHTVAGPLSVGGDRAALVSPPSDAPTISLPAYAGSPECFAPATSPTTLDLPTIPLPILVDSPTTRFAAQPRRHRPSEPRTQASVGNASPRPPEFSHPRTVTGRHTRPAPALRQP